MKFWMNFLLIFVLITSLQMSTGAQSQSKPDQAEDKIVIGTTEVALDIVVRDKNGRPVRNLQASDFDIYEDGVRQGIQSFRLVEHQPVTGGAEVKPGVKKEDTVTRQTQATTRDPFAESSFIAMVFDRLSPDARNLAHKAAVNYVAGSIKPDDLVGVFSIDLSLRTLQNYTSNAELVRQAVDRAANLSTSTFASSAGQVRTLSDRQSALQSATASSEATAAAGGRDTGAAANAAGATTGAAMAEQTLNQMMTSMLQTYETLERDQQGYATTNGLMAIINSLRSRPGRKAIIFFSEGLAIPPAVQTHFRSVINAANRTNVSIYAIDAAGLRVESSTAETAREITALGASRQRQSASGVDDRNGPMMRQLERNEDLLRLNPHSGLGQLASETGGFLIRETNDLSAGLRRIDEDMRVHYMLTYVPTNRNYDGRFRQIEVKLNHPNLEVQTRKGYLAINTLLATPVLDYEAPAIAALRTTGASNSFQMRALELNFPESNRTGLVPVLAEVPASAFTFVADNEKKTYNADFSIVVLIKDESHQVVRKLSQHYQLSGPIEKVEMAKRGDILFYRETELPPGRYTVNTVAYDAVTAKTSAYSSSIDVPTADETKLRLSSVVIVNRVEQLGASDKDLRNPLRFGEVLIYPNTGEPVRKSKSNQLALYFTAYTPAGSTAAPKLAIDVLQNGKAIGHTSGNLPSADATGSIQYASALPLDAFQPGDYELKITVNDGQSSVTRSAHFSIAL
jgi:VWFA-related protein